MPATMTQQQRIATINADLAAFAKGLQDAQPTTEQLAKNLRDFSAQMKDMLPSIASAQKGLAEFDQAKRTPQL